MIGLAGSPTAGQQGVYMLLVRRAPGNATAATFVGDYTERSLGWSPPGPEARSRSATIVADGAGAFSMSGTENSEGAFMPFVRVGNTYSVAVDGAMTIMSGGMPYNGYVMDGGGIAIYAGPTTTPSDPRIAVLIR